MRLKNNRLNIFRLLGYVFLFSLFAGCSNFDLSEHKESVVTKAENSIQVTGKIEPEKIESVKNRSANTSFAMDDSYTMTISALKNDEGNPVSGTIHGNSYSITLHSAGDWTIYLHVEYNDLILVNESVTVSIPEKADSFEITKPLLIRSGYPVDFTGGINLTFKDESEKIANMTYTATVASDVETGNDNSLAEGGSIAFVDGECTLDLDTVKPNPYEVTFCFNDEAGNTLYKCNEAVTVYGGFTTDTWIGEGAHLRKTDDVTEFVITDELIEKFGTEVVPNTKYVLYSYDDSEYINKYYLVDTINSVNIDNPTVSTVSSDNSFCFDDNGYFYALTKREEDHCKIWSNNPALADVNNSIIDGDLGGVITVDRKTGFIYVYDSSYAYITQITQDNGSYAYNDDIKRYKPAKTISLSSDENENAIRGATSFIVNDGFVYFGNADDDVLVILDLSKATPGESEGYYDCSGSTTVALGIADLDVGDSASITDMMYQDGYVYLLIKESAFNFGSGENNFAMTNRGAIIRYSVFTRTISVPLGWTDETNGTVFTFGELAEENEKFLPVYGGYPVYYADQIVDDQGFGSLSEEKEMPVQLASAYTSISGYPVSGETSFKFNTPLLSNIESQFCGPQKFVAIKPKKLVIADSGIAFYTDAEGIWKYKNINRIVTVDLESFSIESDSKESPVNFNEKKTKTLYLQASAYEAGMELTGHASFFTTNGAGSYYSFSGTPYAYAGITNGDD